MKYYITYRELLLSFLTQTYYIGYFHAHILGICAEI